MRNTFSNYLSLVKFSHTVFALPFALIGFFLALHFNAVLFQWQLLMKVLLCMILARTAAMAFNRYADREIDSKNERTAIREIPSGIINANAALALTVFSSLLFIVTCYFINPLCFYLSPVALLVTLGYSFTKRFTSLSHFILGLGLSLAPTGAYLAVTGKFHLLPIPFSFAVLTWVSGFDIIYALQDVDFDRKQKLFSIPAWLGEKNALVFSSVLHFLTACFLTWAGIYANFGMLYWIGSVIFFLMLIYQHSIVKPNDLSRVNISFFTTNGIASVVFSIFVIGEMLY
ncbi:MAG TPA: UbiA-like polyprenyltransferase [Bacteroidia bacterium]|nr:UbiA-like polyprenyltransferase [Bacteroidia bacterium]